MAIIKDVTVKINNGTATLDAPVQFYEKDHDVELRFRLMDYKYKYDKDPQNILNSVDEDILEAYTTIVNPRGYELEQINGVVKNDIVIFRLDPTYTDELDELGTYKLQIHIKCTHSEFTIPPITFEVLQRLKGIKVVTDGEDEVDNSEILDNSSKFVSDETGKLIIEWKKGDMISSAKLNAMVDVINDAVDEEKIRQENEIEREKKANNKIQELENTRVEYVNKFDDELDSFADQVDTTMSDYETRFNALTVSQQQDAEIIDARDGEQTLRARLDRDIQKPSIIYEDIEGSYINVDTTCGYAQNVEILGNTIQNQNDLVDIRSVGDKLENQELYEIPVLSTGRNLVDAYTNLGEAMFFTSNGGPSENPAWRYTIDYFRVEPNREIAIGETYTNYRQYQVSFYDVNYKWIETRDITPHIISTITPQNAYYMRFSYSVFVSGSPVDRVGLQVEYGSITTPYEEYREDKLTILSPTPLEKVGDVADRIVCKDGVWGVEKNIEDFIIPGGLTWDEYITSIPSGATGGYIIVNLSDCNMIVKEKDYHAISDKNIILKGSSVATSSSIGIFLRPESKTIYIKDYVSNLEEMKLKYEGSLIKYPTTQPQFIPLPYEQQIKLRTFANKTNIHFLTEIEPTLKASVPKSISATVSTHTEQIDNLGKELDRVKKLEESTVSTVTTESDFTTVENTSNGYFEDVKLEGRTLVNAVDTSNVHFSTGMIWMGILNAYKNKKVTVFVRVSNEDTSYMKVAIYRHKQDGSTAGPFIQYANSYVNKPFVADFSTDSATDFDSYIVYLHNHDGEAYLPINKDNVDFMVLEGDHTQNPPSFFEGLKSVGQDVDEISVLSCNENIFDKEYCYKKTLENDKMGEITRFYENGKDIIRFNQDGTRMVLHDNFKENTQYTIKLKLRKCIDNVADARLRVLYSDSTKKENGLVATSTEFVEVNYTTDKNKTVLRIENYFGNSKNFSEIDLDSVVIVEGTEIKDIQRKQDKKRILYYNDETQTWDKPILREWDSIEKHSDGKYYYHKRSEEVVLDGSENWMNPIDFTNCIRMRYLFNKLPATNDVVILNDKFSLKHETYAETDEEGVWNNQFQHLNITILKSKLSTPDLAGFKAWLQANNVTVVYQLSEEKVYECTDLDLITYENETNYIVTAGAIAPVSTLKVMCNINNVVRELQQKVSNLENYIQHVMIDALNNALNE